jgi:hypothetical protein
MCLKDEFKALVCATRLEEQAKRLLSLSDEQWKSEIREILGTVLLAAQDGLNVSKIDSQAQPLNGTGFMLTIAAQTMVRGSRPRDLRFEFQGSELQISSESDPDLCERWGRSHVTREIVISKVKEFVRRVAIDQPEDAPVDRDLSWKARNT